MANKKQVKRKAKRLPKVTQQKMKKRIANDKKAKKTTSRVTAKDITKKTKAVRAKRINRKQVTRQEILKNLIPKQKKSISSLEIGDIVRLTYRNETGDVHDLKPLILVLNPKWKKHIHAIRLSAITLKELKMLIGIVKPDNLDYLDEIPISDKKAVLKAVFDESKNHEMYRNPLKFYNNTLKKLIHKYADTPYRTYRIDRVSSVANLYDFKFIMKGYKAKVKMGKKSGNQKHEEELKRQMAIKKQQAEIEANKNKNKKK